MLAIWSSLVVAYAEDPSPESELEDREEPEHEEPHHGLIAFRTSGGLGLGEVEHELELGTGAVIESPELHHLALELAIGAVMLEEGAEIPVELLVERVFEIGEHLEPYLGLGPSVVAPQEGPAHLGAVGAAGAHVWLDQSLGVLLESDLVCLTGGESRCIAEGLLGLAVRLP
ncbi:MAG: hypothetical protein H6738_17975 [Alphaproteobacteria bacterium]|nr:hypothetical protein [Alphaproteobacteria bacterium]